jgi:hypothetical protein
MSDIIPLPTMEQILALQDLMKSLPQVKVTTKHYFADGMYCREMFRPAGTTIVGRVHKKEHFYIIIYGELTVIGEGYRERLKGPTLIISKPGTKRVVFAHTDALCITIHRTPFTNLDEVEEDISVVDPESPYTTGNTLKPGIVYEEPL